jgi:hypothetical protein
MGASSTASAERLELNLLLSEKRGGNSHFGIIPHDNVLKEKMLGAKFDMEAVQLR